AARCAPRTQGTVGGGQWGVEGTERAASSQKPVASTLVPENRKPKTENRKPKSLPQAVTNGPDRGTSSGVGAELGEDVLDVLVDGAAAEEEGIGDLLIGPVLREQAQHLGVARCQPRRDGDSGGWLCVSGVGRGLLLSEDRVGIGQCVIAGHRPAGGPFALKALRGEGSAK